jgi:D-alanine-D-alanine ligase-like ATP-grasp enzyme
MSDAQSAEIRRVVYVSRQMTGESLRSAKAINKLRNVQLFGICEHTPDMARAQNFVDVIGVTNTEKPDQLVAAAHVLAQKHGPLYQFVTAQETLLESVAEANQALALRGMSPATVRGTLNKACFRQTLNQAGIKTAEFRLVTAQSDAQRFAGELGFPIVLKVLNGSGGLGTWCVRSSEQLHAALDLLQPTSTNVLLAEQYVDGPEIAIDTITIQNEPQFYSVCSYGPPILEALENPETQWTCIMPRDISEVCDPHVIGKALTAVRALEVGNAMTHMEALLREDGDPVFIDATLRPAGARIGPMLGFAYDIDTHLAWTRAVIDGAFDGPWARKYAVGTIFLRGKGSGSIEHVEGLEIVKQMVPDLIVDARLPLLNAAKAASYTGDGYITVRHSETRVVEQALRSIAETISITYSESEQRSQQQIRVFDQQMTKPAWEDDSRPTF